MRNGDLTTNWIFDMPLRIKLPSKEKLIINGAVIENSGEATTIILHNRVDILRRKEVMSEEEANSPARRVYYALQCAYLFDNDRPRYLDLYQQFSNDYREAAPSAESILAEVDALVGSEKFYDALRKTQDLIDHEADRLEAIATE